MASGYGTQTALLSRLLADDGHDVAISALFGLHGGMIEWDGIPVFPAGTQQYSQDVIVPHARSFFGRLDAGVILLLHDVWVQYGKLLAQTNLLPWTPVDHEPAPPKVRQFFVDSGARPVAMSRFGERMLADFSPMYAPHGIDLELFNPVGRKAARQVLRDHFHVPVSDDQFFVVQVGTNKGKPDRKGWSATVPAYSRLAGRHDDTYMFGVTEPMGIADGIPMGVLAEAHGIDNDRIGFAEPYEHMILGYPPEFLVALYSAADVSLNPSWGEGFGIPIVEAQACGCRVVTRDATAMPELTGPGSIKVGGWREWTYQNSYMFPPDPGDIYQALERIYDKRLDGPHRPSVEFASQYDHRRVYDERWRPILADADDRFFADKPSAVEVVA